jgi:integrase
MVATKRRLKSAEPRSPRRHEKLSDAGLSSRHDFRTEFETPPVLWDTEQPGLLVRFGKRRSTFVFRQEHRKKGKRSTTYKRLGFYPEISLKEARRLAKIEAGEVARGNITPSQREATTVGKAMAAYIAHLKEKVGQGEKSAKWVRQVESAAKNHILPAFDNYTLRELTQDHSADVKAWHVKIKRNSGPIAADHASKILRAVYRRAGIREDLPARLPTREIEFKERDRSQRALAFEDFPQWYKAWQKIESPTRRAFQMICLLTGARPGELARTKWADVFPTHPERKGKRMMRSFVIRSAKAKNDIYIPLSPPLVKELKRARDVARAIKPQSVYIFPARADGHIVKFDVDDLPAWGMMLRRTYRTIAADLGVDELTTHFLMGHVPSGISRGYVAKMTLSGGQGMRNAQRRISARIVELMGCF